MGPKRRCAVPNKMLQTVIARRRLACISDALATTPESLGCWVF
jgi:hypothetical protein